MLGTYKKITHDKFGGAADSSTEIYQQGRSTEGTKSQASGPGISDSEISTSPILGATALLAAKYPPHISDAKDRKSRAETRYVLMFVLVVLAAVGYGWSQWSGINFQSDGDFYYNSGLIGGIIMLVVLLYAVVKRIKVMRKIGQMEIWYYIHLIGGIVGPILIVFHAAFDLKAVNSTVAFISMLLIVASGFFGRYVYTRVGYGLHRKLIDIKRTEVNLVRHLRSHQNDIAFALERRLANFALASLAGPRSVFLLPFRFVAIRAEAAKCYVHAIGEITRMLKFKAHGNGWTMDDFNRQLKAEKALIRHHINAVVGIAQVHVWERLLVRWRLLHIPLLYILLVTGLAHVLAVHMY